MKPRIGSIVWIALDEYERLLVCGEVKAIDDDGVTVEIIRRGSGWTTGDIAKFGNRWELNEIEYHPHSRFRWYPKPEPKTPEQAYLLDMGG